MFGVRGALVDTVEDLQDGSWHLRVEEEGLLVVDRENGTIVRSVSGANFQYEDKLLLLLKYY